jgi:hypothetical protein
MPGTRKPRKGYRPAPVYANTVLRAVGGACRIAPGEVAAQQQRIRHALQAFSAGQHCAHHWRSLADVANMAETLAEMRIGAGEEADAVIQQAQQTLAEVWARHTARGTWTLYPAELDALHWLLRLHEVQMQVCSYSEFEEAFQRTTRRIAQARAGNAPPSARVIHGDIGTANHPTSEQPHP